MLENLGLRIRACGVGFEVIELKGYGRRITQQLEATCPGVKQQLLKEESVVDNLRLQSLESL